MQEQMQARLDELRRDFETGTTEIQQLQAREKYLHETMLRINGAIQVLEELLAEEQCAGQHCADPSETQSAFMEADGLNVQQTEFQAVRLG